jgi:hypothetical protein
MEKLLLQVAQLEGQLLHLEEPMPPSKLLEDTLKSLRELSALAEFPRERLISQGLRPLLEQFEVLSEELPHLEYSPLYSQQVEQLEKSLVEWLPHLILNPALKQVQNETLAGRARQEFAFSCLQPWPIVASMDCCPLPCPRHSPLPLRGLRRLRSIVFFPRSVLWYAVHFADALCATSEPPTSESVASAVFS